MYNLGEQFKVKYESAKANDKSVILGAQYRFTVLKEGLLRLEYSKEGVFTDAPTELVWFRNFPTPEFTIREDNHFLELSTKIFKLTYIKNKPFLGSKLNPKSNLRVELLGTDKVWYFGHPEVRNYQAPGMALDSDGETKVKGLYSPDGFASINDSKSSILEETGTLISTPLKRTDIYLFMYNKDFKTCLKDYYDLTGKPALIPRYALGNWWSRDIDYTDQDVAKLVEDFDHHNVPLSVFLLNSAWHKKPTDKKKTVNTGFSWDKEKYPNYLKLIKYLHSKGIRLGLNINPIENIYPIEDSYAKAAEYLGVTDGEVIPFNALNPRFLDVYLKLIIHPLDNNDVDFYWIDTNDKKLINEHWILNHYHFYDMLRNYKKRSMMLSRNTLIAPHRYPVMYAGKETVGWETLKKIPFYNVSGFNIGVSYLSHDIGGYHKGVEDDELYVRYVQLGVFSPILKFGSAGGKYYKREPWRWSIKTYNITQNYLTMRHRMIPYLYSESYNYYKEGIPLIEPLYYHEPKFFDDLNYRNQYFLGSELFISPIVNKKDTIMNRVIHKFYMPSGLWYDFVTGKKFPGNKAYVSFFKDQDYPVFAKAGAIIPFGTNENINSTNPPKNMEFHIFPGQNNVYKLYEDDGVSDLYRQGFYLLTSIEYNYLPNNYTVIIRPLEGKSGIVPDTRNYMFRFRNTKKADEVLAYIDSVQVESKSYIDGTDFVVEVNDVKTIGQFTLNCKGKDIEIDAVRIINEDISTIISDLQIDTELKGKIDAALFNDLPVKKKRIAIRKLRRVGLENKFVKLFLKLLEYIDQV